MGSRGVDLDLAIDEERRPVASYAVVDNWTVQPWGPDYWPTTTTESSRAATIGAGPRRAEAPGNRPAPS